MNTKVPAPGWFTAVAIIALLWNLFGVAAYLMAVVGPMLMTPEVLATLPEAERAQAEEGLAQMAATPGWVTGAFAFATFGGLLGSILLLLKKNLAVPLFALSLAGVVVQQVWGLFLSGAEVAGGALVLPVVVLVFAGFLLWLALKAKREGWSN